TYDGLAPPYEFQAYKPTLIQLEGWLNKGPYAPDKYKQLSFVFQSNGDTNFANQIAYLGKIAETQQAWNEGRYGNWLLLAAQRVLIGYGYSTWYALLWSLGFVV